MVETGTRICNLYQSALDRMRTDDLELRRVVSGEEYADIEGLRIESHEKSGDRAAICRRARALRHIAIDTYFQATISSPAPRVDCDRFYRWLCPGPVPIRQKTLDWGV